MYGIWKKSLKNIWTCEKFCLSLYIEKDIKMRNLTRPLCRCIYTFIYIAMKYCEKSLRKCKKSL